MSTFNRVSVLRRAVAVAKGEKITKIDKPEDQKPVLEKAGIQVSNKDPKYGVYEHELGGQKIGHTVNVTGQGWTAVPAVGEIQGKFKKHMEAQQYLADNHVENTKTQLIEEAAANKPKVKKDDLGNDEEDLDDPDADSVEKSVAAIVSTIITVQKDWAAFDAARGDPGMGKTTSKIAKLTDNNEHTKSLMAGAKALGRMDIHDKLKAVLAQHNKDGHMTQENMADRKTQADRLDAHAKANLTPSEYGKFNSAY
jgi:hypothetical protein